MSDEIVAYKGLEGTVVEIAVLLKAIQVALKNGKEACHFDREGETQTRAEQ